MELNPDFMQYALEEALDMQEVMGSVIQEQPVREAKHKYTDLHSEKKDQALDLFCKMFIGYPVFMDKAYWIQEEDLKFSYIPSESCIIIENVDPLLLKNVILDPNVTEDKIFNGVYVFIDYGVIEYAILEADQSRDTTKQDDITLEQWNFLYPDVLQKYSKQAWTDRIKEIFYEKIKKHNMYLLLSKFIQDLYSEDVWKINSKLVYLWDKHTLLWKQTPVSDIHNHVIDVVSYAVCTCRTELDAEIKETGESIVAIQSRTHTEERKLSVEEKQAVAQLKEKKKQLQYKHSNLSKYVGLKLDRLLQQVIGHSVFHLERKDAFLPNNTVPYYLPIRMGRAVNLKTGKVRPRVRADHFTQETNVKEYYSPKEDFYMRKHLVFYKFLEPYMLKLNKECRDYFKLMFGYFLTGSNTAKAFFIWFGEYGNEGKSAFLRFFLQMMGGLARTLPKQAFVQKNSKKNKAVREIQTSGSSATPELMALQNGVRLAVIAETDGDEILNDAFVKRNTGGDKQYARGLYASATEFTYGGKFLITSNYFPCPQEMSDAMQKRIKLISTFMQMTTDAKKAKDNSNTFYYSDPEVLRYMESQEGIDSLFVYCLQGAIKHYQDPTKIIQLPKTYRDCLNEHLSEMSVPVFFIKKIFKQADENMHPNLLQTYKLRDVYHTYLEFAEMHCGLTYRCKVEHNKFAQFRGFLIKNGYNVMKHAMTKDWIVCNVCMLDKVNWPEYNSA